MLTFIQYLDDRVLHIVQNYLTCPFTDWLMSLLSDKRYLLPVLVVLIPYLAIKQGTRGRRALLVVILAASLTDVVSSRLLKPTFHRLRPYQLEAVKAGQKPGGSFSFPSSHSANVAAAVTGLALYFPRVIPLLTALWLAVSLSRIYLNAHYPTDCLGGLLVGITIAATIWYVVEWSFRRMKRRKKHIGGQGSGVGEQPKTG